MIELEFVLAMLVCHVYSWEMEFGEGFSGVGGPWELVLLVSEHTLELNKVCGGMTPGVLGQLCPWEKLSLVSLVL